MALPFYNLWFAYPRLFNNPVIKREVVERLRKASSFLYLFICLIIVLFYLLSQWHSRGINIFYFSYYLQTQYVSFNICIGCAAVVLASLLSATGINLEYERESWDLLLTTHLSPSSIVLAKLLSSIFYICIIILGMTPFHFIFLAMGTVGSVDILLINYLIIETILICGLIGLCCSSLFNKPIQSITATLAGAAFYTVGTVVVSVFYSQGLAHSPLLFGLPLLSSPFFLALLYVEGSPPPYFASPWVVSHQYILHLAMNIAFIIFLYFLCLYLLQRKSIVKSPTQKVSLIQSFGIRKFLRNNKRVQSYTALEIPDEVNPVYWKERKINENNRRIGNYAFTSVLFFLSFVLLMNQISYDSSLSTFRTRIQWDEIIFWLLFLIPFFVMPYAVNSVRGEKDGSTWEILTTCALLPQQILWGKMAGGLRLFLWRFFAFYGGIFIASICLYFNFSHPIRFLFDFPFLRDNHFSLVSACFALSFVWGFFYLAGGILFSTLFKQTSVAYLATVLFYFSILFIPITLTILLNMLSLFSPTPLWQDPLFIEINSVASPFFLLTQYFDFLRQNDPLVPGLLWLKFVIYQAMWMSAAGCLFLYLAHKRIQQQD